MKIKQSGIFCFQLIRMKLVDTFYVASFYDCMEKLKNDPEIDEITSEQLLKKVEMKRLKRLARIALEDAIKVINNAVASDIYFAKVYHLSYMLVYFAKIFHFSSNGS